LPVVELTIRGAGAEVGEADAVKTLAVPLLRSSGQIHERKKKAAMEACKQVRVWQTDHGGAKPSIRKTMASSGLQEKSNHTRTKKTEPKTCWPWSRCIDQVHRWKVEEGFYSCRSGRVIPAMRVEGKEGGLYLVMTGEIEACRRYH